MRNNSEIRPVGLVAVAVLAAGIGCRPRTTDGDAAPKVAHEPGLPSESRPVRIIYPAAPGSFVDLAADLKASVVHVFSTTKVTGGPDSIFPGGEQGGYALGSGFILDTEGHIVTNNHILANAREVRVALSLGDKQVVHGAKIIGRDPKLDLALLKIPASERLKPASLGSSEHLQVGEWVVALGNPFGDEVTVSAGIITALGVTAEDRRIGPPPVNYRAFLRTDADIHAGNSGGPLINTAGEVVGLNSATKVHNATLGLAAPIDLIRRMVPQLKAEGGPSPTWLGIMMHPVTKEVARQRRLPEVTGALVSEVIPGGPAAKAGMKPGDVILKFEGRDVDHKNLSNLATTTGAGNRIDVVVWRNGGTVSLKLTSERLPR